MAPLAREHDNSRRGQDVRRLPLAITLVTVS
jgi:hypothetical protein